MCSVEDYSFIFQEMVRICEYLGVEDDTFDKIATLINNDIVMRKSFAETRNTLLEKHRKLPGQYSRNVRDLVNLTKYHIDTNKECSGCVSVSSCLMSLYRMALIKESFLANDPPSVTPRNPPRGG